MNIPSQPVNHQSDLQGATPLCIKLNNAATNDPCALCGKRTDPVVGPEIFVEGTWALVCHRCARRAAPELLPVLSRFHENAGLSLERTCERGISAA